MTLHDSLAPVAGCDSKTKAFPYIAMVCLELQTLLESNLATSILKDI